LSYGELDITVMTLCIYGKGQATIQGSVEFLTSYACSLNLAGQVHPQGKSEKGKEKIHEGAAKEPWFQEVRTSNNGHQARWRLPPAVWAKVNTDAGYFQDTCMASTGAVLRDAEGNMLMAAWKTVSNVAAAEEAEALACLDGIRLAAEEVSRPVVVETDCFMLVQAVNRDGNPRARWSSIIEEIKANQVAHGLARLAKQRRQDRKMHGNVPQEL
jgi:ribonuclease HI